MSLKIHPRENTFTWINAFRSIGLEVDVVDPMTHFPAGIFPGCTRWSPSRSFYDAFSRCLCFIAACGDYVVSELFEENNDLMPHIPSPSSINSVIDRICSEVSRGLVLNDQAKAVLNGVPCFRSS